MKADMLGCQTATLENAQGAVFTDAVVAAYAVGDIKDLKKVFQKNLEIKEVYDPREENTVYYRDVYKLQRKLVGDDMKPAFATLQKIEQV